MSILLMARTVLKSLFTKPVTERYPFAPRQYPKDARGKVAVDITKCIFCSLCQKKCPTAALRVNRTDKCWTIERMRCITCGACVDVCPRKCLSMENRSSPVSRSKEEETFRA